MSAAYVDTDAIVRFISGDDLSKRRAVEALLIRVRRGELNLVFPDVIIADILYVLCSPNLYDMPREDVVESLGSILLLPGVHVREKRTMLDAMAIYQASRLGFGDCYIVASMRSANATTVYSYDRHLDRFNDIDRVEP